MHLKFPILAHGRQIPLSRRSCLRLGLGAALGTLSAGCGTLMYPERRGQKGRRLDWKVVLLDGIGLIFFFVPGVVAFAVDFINGTIYLPEEPPCEPPCAPTPAGVSLKPIKIPRDSLHPAGIEKAIAAHTGKSISLRDGDYVACELESIDEFWQKKESMEGHSLNRAV
ncbi:hypothetical protein [Planctomicrobium piriforme]|uniref:Uncharacterized protein n=1 Tax=Planctomicrobium piriforme TaxID=1576369 RepID=A0A1I3CC92_9PLAN|nr:hypothetical protein [Planctomicrobium piriforme]SFH72152.1 hypothetical protein SAMN05421753_102220 [Planctomicrobium piriforme]